LPAGSNKVDGRQNTVNKRSMLNGIFSGDGILRLAQPAQCRQHVCYIFKTIARAMLSP
jgi:hypothetical protein